MNTEEEFLSSELESHHIESEDLKEIDSVNSNPENNETETNLETNFDLDTLNVDNLSEDDILEIAKRFNFKTKDEIKNPSKNYIDDPKEYLNRLKTDYPLVKATAATIATTNKKLQKQNEEYLAQIRNLESKINSVQQVQNSYEELSLKDKMQTLETQQSFLQRKLSEAIENGDSNEASNILQQTERIIADKIALKSKIDNFSNQSNHNSISEVPKGVDLLEKKLQESPPQVREFIKSDGSWYLDKNWTIKADLYLETLEKKDPSITVDEKIYKLRQWRKKQIDNIDYSENDSSRQGISASITPGLRNSTVRGEDYRGLSKEDIQLFNMIKESNPKFTKEKFLRNREMMKLHGNH